MHALAHPEKHNKIVPVALLLSCYSFFVSFYGTRISEVEKDGRTSIIPANWVTVPSCLPAADDLPVEGGCYWNVKPTNGKPPL